MMADQLKNHMFEYIRYGETLLYYVFVCNTKHIEELYEYAEQWEYCPYCGQKLKGDV